MNKEQYLYYQRFFATHRVWKFFAGFFATKIVWVYVLGFAVLLFWTEGRFLAVSGVMVAGVGKLFLDKWIAFLWPSERPYQKFGFQPVAGVGLFSDADETKDSFPSGHVTAMSAITFLLFYTNLYLAILSCVFVLFCGVSRVLLGFHFWRDVLGGVALGLLVAWAFFLSGFIESLAWLIFPL